MRFLWTLLATLALLSCVSAEPSLSEDTNSNEDSNDLPLAEPEPSLLAAAYQLLEDGAERAAYTKFVEVTASSRVIACNPDGR